MLTQDPIGLAGGVNLYSYAGNNPISFFDPFGLDTVEVGCRKVEGSAGMANHCAVRVKDDAGQDQVGELLNKGDTNAVVVWPGSSKSADNYNWTPVSVPSGMTQQQFDASVANSFNKTAKGYRGASYDVNGKTNSNYFIFKVIEGAGGTVPRGVLRFGVTPGICGGGSGGYQGMNSFLKAGSQCGH